MARGNSPVRCLLFCMLLCAACRGPQTGLLLNIGKQGTTAYLSIQYAPYEAKINIPITYCCVFEVTDARALAKSYSFHRFLSTAHRYINVLYEKDMNALPADELEALYKTLETWQLPLGCPGADHTLCIEPGREYGLFVASLNLGNMPYPVFRFTRKGDKLTIW